MGLFGDNFVMAALDAGVLVVLALASIVFLCTAVIAAALMLRGRWEKFGDSDKRGS